jgi:hypothetical protein
MHQQIVARFQQLINDDHPTTAPSLLPHSVDHAIMLDVEFCSKPQATDINGSKNLSKNHECSDEPAVTPVEEFRGSNISDEDDTEYHYSCSDNDIYLLGSGPDGTLRTTVLYPSPTTTISDENFNSYHLDGSSMNGFE